MFAPDRRRAFGHRLLLSMLLYFLLYLNGVSLMLTYEQADPLQIYLIGDVVGLTSLVLPLLAALPGATLFAADWTCGVARCWRARCGDRRYLVSKLTASALSGGLAAVGGTLLFILFLNLKYPPDFSAEPMMIEMTGLEALLLGGGARAYLTYYTARLALQFLAGALWATAALAFSAFYPNAALSLCAPLIAYRAVSEMGSAGWLPDAFNPTLLDSGAAGLSAALTLLAALAVLGGLSSLLGALFYGRAKRRLQDA